MDIIQNIFSSDNKSYPQTNILSESELDENTSFKKILDFVGENKYVLDIGCATGYLASLLKQRDCRVVGIDINEKSANAARKVCEQVIIADLDFTPISELLAKQKFDVAIFGDVLEHLRNPWQILQDTHKILSEDGFIVASIPNIAHGATRLSLLKGDFEYQKMGILDSTHLRFFTRYSIEKLFENTGYLVSDIERTIVPVFEQSELIPDLNPSEFNRAILGYLEEREEIETLQFIVKAFPTGDKKSILFHERIDELKSELEQSKERLLSTQLKLKQSNILLLNNQSEIQQLKAISLHNQSSLALEALGVLKNFSSKLNDMHSYKMQILSDQSRYRTQTNWRNLFGIYHKIHDLLDKKIKFLNLLLSNTLKAFLQFQKVFWWIVSFQFNKKMARRKVAQIITNSGLFDTGYYWKQIPNDPIANKDPLGHYIDVGVSKFLNPHPLFDTKFYLENYPEVIENNINPLAHYLLTGARQGYQPHPLFNTEYYIQEYPDVLDSGINPLYHYSQIGVNENRDPFKCCKIKIGFPYISRDFPVCLEGIPKSNSTEYQKWLDYHYPSPIDLAQMKIKAKEFKYQPLISIIMPTFNTKGEYLREAIQSVLDQVYEKWELCIADDCSTKKHVRPILEEYKKQDERIRVLYRETNGHISAASNSALSLAQGEFIAHFDHDDLLTPHALFRVVELLNKQVDADMIYSDEDKINDDGLLSDAYFKPDWCPDSFLSRMYICHLGIYRRSIVEEINGFRLGYEGSQDYDLVLRFTEKTNKIFHIPDILYHWRIHPESAASGLSSKLYAIFAAKRAIADALKRRGEPGEVTDAPFYPGNYLVRYKIEHNDLVSIIIPTRDMGGTLENCLKSVFELSTYPDFEVIVVDNGSTESLAKKVLNKWSLRQPRNFKVINMDIPFNFSKLNNYAVQHSKGKYLLFLNNDTEVITPDWIEAMVEQSQRISIGAVGNMLLYPDNTIQHAGVVNGIAYCCRHVHRPLKLGDHGYFNYLNLVNNYSAVTGASLMCRRSVFDEVGGFDEILAVNFNDIDLCLKMIEKGYQNVYLPHVRLYHYESKSRGYDFMDQNMKARLYCEAKYFQTRWQKIIEQDPCYNPNLTIEYEDFRIRHK